MTNSKKDSDNCYCNCHTPSSSAINCKHCAINPVLTYPSKDSELESILNYYGMRCSYEAIGSVPSDAELLTRDQAIQAINSNYITKEESDRRVLEGRIDELQTHGDQWRVWLDDTKNVKLIYVVNWYDLRIAELRELLNGDKDGISKRD